MHFCHLAFKIDNLDTVESCMTEMASHIWEFNSTECPVCLDDCKEPKILPCAHILCRHCLVQWMRKSSNAQCPLCLGDIRDTEDNTTSSHEKFADSLPTDHATVAVAECKELLGKEFQCHVHTGKAAESLCLQCRVKLCANCVRDHRRLPLSSSHRVENLKTLTLERLIRTHLMSCSSHAETPAALFCPSHSIAICHSCAFKEHSNCADLTEMKSKLTRLKQSLSNMKATLMKAEFTLKQAMSKYDNDLIAYHATCNASIKEIDSVCDRLQSSLETYRNLMKQRVKDTSVAVDEAVAARKNILRLKYDRVTTHVNLLNRVQNTATDASLLLMVDTLASRMKELDVNTSIPADVHPIVVHSLAGDEEVIRRLQQEHCKLIEVKATHKWAGGEENVWQFNSKHGKNIKLYHEGQTAVSIGQCFGTVMSKNPMAINKLYEVKVEKTREGFTGKGILVGVVSGVSKEIEHMPYANKIDKAVAVMSSYSCLYTEKRNEIRCPLLENVKVDNRIGVMVDGAHCLHLYVDGKDQRVIVPGIRLPCYAMFDLYVYLQKITTLPVTDVN